MLILIFYDDYLMKMDINLIFNPFIYILLLIFILLIILFVDLDMLS